MSKQSKILTAIILGTFMVILDQTIVNIALPHIITVFHETADRAQLVISAYIMANAVSVPLAAYLSKKFGTKWVFIFSQVGFCVGSILCGFSWNLASLICFRVIQGLSGGLLMPLAMTMIFAEIPPEKRGSAMATLGISMMIAPAMGPTLGGYLVDSLSWHWCFFINIPVIIAAVTLGTMWIKDTDKGAVTFDIKGFILAAIGLSTLLYGLSYAPTWGWTDDRIIFLFVVAIISLVSWAMIELRSKNPILDLSVFKFRGYSLGTGINFVTTVALFSTEFLFPLFMQNIKQMSAFNTGLLLIAFALGSAIAMPVSGRLYDRLGPKLPVVMGLLITGFATLLYYNIDVTTPNSFITMILFLRGIGVGLSMMPVMTYALASVPSELTMQASSLTTVSRTIFAALGTALFASILDTFQKHYLGTLVQLATPDSVDALRILSTVQATAVASGISLEGARQLGLYVLYQLVNLRSSIMSFDSVWVISAIMVILAALPALMLPLRIQHKAKPIEQLAL
jgi:EmrB/QacA subfamily drug resistance transporter